MSCPLTALLYHMSTTCLPHVYLDRRMTLLGSDKDWLARYHEYVTGWDIGLQYWQTCLLLGQPYKFAMSVLAVTSQYAMTLDVAIT